MDQWQEAYLGNLKMICGYLLNCGYFKQGHCAFVLLYGVLSCRDTAYSYLLHGYTLDGCQNMLSISMLFFFCFLHQVYKHCNKSKHNYNTSTWPVWRP